MSKAMMIGCRYFHCCEPTIYEGPYLRCTGQCKKLFHPPAIDLVEVDEATPYVDEAKMLLEEFHKKFSAIPEHYRRRAWSQLPEEIRGATYDLIQRLYFSR